LPIDEHRIGAESAGVGPARQDSELAAVAPSHESDELLTLLGTLSAAHREVAILRHVKGLSYREMSTTLRIPLGTVMSRLSRAHLALARNARAEGALCSQPVEIQ
jgi:RNA polymerase sigma-70 factor (ECF subfamily)